MHRTNDVFIKKFKWPQLWIPREDFPTISDAFSVCEQENEFLCLNTEFLTTIHMLAA